MKKLFLIFLALPLFGQTTYTSSKYKPVWYSSTYEKTHGTYALFDTSSIKLSWTTSGKPEFKMLGPTGTTLFYIDSTGSIATGGAPATCLLKTAFDDSLNNAHTVLNSWGFRKNATTGAVPLEALRLELIDPTVDLNAGEGPALNFYVAETGTQQLSGQVASVRESVTNANAAAALTFSTAADDAALTEYMRITSVGRVGIGTTSPQNLLSIVNGTPTVNIVDSDVNKLRNSQAQATDTSSLKFDASTAFPTIQFSGSDGDQYTISGNTSDQAVFSGASGGYAFDSYGSFTGGVVINNTAVAPTAISGRMYFQGINNADADTLFFYNGTAWKQFISE